MQRHTVHLKRFKGDDSLERSSPEVGKFVLLIPIKSQSPCHSANISLF